MKINRIIDILLEEDGEKGEKSSTRTEDRVRINCNPEFTDKLRDILVYLQMLLDENISFNLVLDPKGDYERAFTLDAENDKIYSIS